MLKLNLGCSDDHKPGYLNVDCAYPDWSSGKLQDFEWANLAEPWPWEDSTVDYILAHDVFEHLPKIHAMNEAFRVLKKGCCLDLVVPCVMLSDGRVNPGAFADPTHVSFWTPDDRYYYCEPWNNSLGERGRLGPAYGITALFRQIRWEALDYGAIGERRSKVFALLEAVK